MSTMQRAAPPAAAIIIITHPLSPAEADRDQLDKEEEQGAQAWPRMRHSVPMEPLTTGGIAAYATRVNDELVGIAGIVVALEAKRVLLFVAREAVAPLPGGEQRGRDGGVALQPPGARVARPRRPPPHVLEL